MTEKLQHCLFCKKDTASVSVSSGIEDDTTFVECLTCGARGPDFDGYSRQQDIKDAIEAWNSWVQ